MFKDFFTEIANKVNAKKIKMRKELCDAELMVEDDRFSIYRFWNKESCQHIGFIIIDHKDGNTAEYKGDIFGFLSFLKQNFKELELIDYDGESIILNT